MDKPQHLAKLINWALADLMLEHGEIVLAGEDVGPKGGVYNVTSRASGPVRPARVINTLLDEQSILGLGIGLAHNGLLPIPEIQFLAYVHNAEDQLRGEASTLSFFSNGQYTNPDDRADRRPRLPEGLRRPLPQRQLARGPARHPRADHRLPEQRRRRRGHAARVRAPGARGAACGRLPRADRSLHDPRPARREGRPVDVSLRRRRARPKGSRLARVGSPRRRAAIWPSSATATAITSSRQAQRSSARSTA